MDETTRQIIELVSDGWKIEIEQTPDAAQLLHVPMQIVFKRSLWGGIAPQPVAPYAYTINRYQFAAEFPKVIDEFHARVIAPIVNLPGWNQDTPSAEL